MAHKPPKNQIDADTLKPFEFQEFVQYFPHAALTKAKITRRAFHGVAMALSRHGEFATGTEVWPSIGTLADESGFTKPTVRRVLAYLQALGAIVVTGQRKPRGGGSPITEYRFFRSPAVTHCLQVKDRTYGGKQQTTVMSQGQIEDPTGSTGVPLQGQLAYHDKNTYKNSQELSVADAPSISTLRESIGDEEEQFTWDLEDVDELVADL